MNNNAAPQNLYPIPQDGYVAFDAFSLRSLILNRLNNENIFTDQNYVGSNLAAIIDIISFAYNSLIFYLNQTSNEAMFTEAQLYENVNRIVKLLDYKPVGYQTSTLAFQLSGGPGFTAGTYTIPRYSYINVGNYAFSFNRDITFKINNSGVITPLTDISDNVLLYEGTYREAPLYTANGDSNEVVTLNFGSSTIDHFNLDVYVYEQEQQKWVQYNYVQNLYNEQSQSRTFEKRLNSNQNYEITFGDGINGRQLATGDLVVIYALESSGLNAVVGPGAVSNVGTNFQVYATFYYNQILPNVTSSENYNFLNNLSINYLLITNATGSTYPVATESINSIKTNAPKTFKSQNRLVTAEDYKNYILTNYANFVSDVKVFNNWDYVGKYLKYFNDIEVSPIEFKQLLLNSVSYSDSCNFNNVYICAKPRTSPTTSLKYLLPNQKEIIASDANSLKTISAEITFLDPIYKLISLGLPAGNNLSDYRDERYCYLEIVKNINSKRANESIISDVLSVFQTYFNSSNIMLGDMLDYSAIVSAILAVEGVSKIRTKRTDTSDMYDGLSLNVWNPNYSDMDIQRVTNNLLIEDFETFYFSNLSTLNTKIVVTTS